MNVIPLSLAESGLYERWFQLKMIMMEQAMESKDGQGSYFDRIEVFLRKYCRIINTFNLTRGNFIGMSEDDVRECAEEFLKIDIQLMTIDRGSHE